MPRDTHNNRKSSPYVKYDLKGFIKLALYLAFLVLVVLMVIKIAVVPKDPVTAEQAWNIMEKQGYEPQNIAESYYKKDSGFKSTLNKCIAFEKGDIHFEFFEFNDKSSAVDLYSQAHSKIILAKNKFHVIETVNKTANYAIYTLDDDDTYNVAIYVENTAVYAYSNSENKTKIIAVLSDMDYLSK